MNIIVSSERAIDITTIGKGWSLRYTDMGGLPAKMRKTSQISANVTIECIVTKRIIYQSISIPIFGKICW